MTGILRRAALLPAPLAALALVGCDNLAANPAPKATASAPAGTATADRAEAPTKVTVVRPEVATIRRTTEQPGQVEAFESAAIQARLPGYVAEVKVDIGDRVARGDLLARLDVPEVEAELAQRRAAIAQAQAEVTQAKAAVDVAEAALNGSRALAAEARAALPRTEAELARWDAELNRVAQLVRESALTGSLLDETRSKRESAAAARDEARARVVTADAAQAEAQAALAKAQADIEAATARVAVAEADARRVQALLGFARITAPFDGVVVRRLVDPGHLTRMVGEPQNLFLLDRVDRVTVVVYIPESEAPRVEAGDKLEIRVPALEGRTVAGTIARTSWALDAATRTLRAEADLPGDDGVLRPGLYVLANVVAEERPDVLSVPVTAVLREGGEAACLVVAGGRVERRPVELGLSDGNRVEIRSGLGPDDRVAGNATAVTVGQAAEPVEAEPAKG